MKDRSFLILIAHLSFQYWTDRNQINKTTAVEDLKAKNHSVLTYLKRYGFIQRLTFTTLSRDFQHSKRSTQRFRWRNKIHLIKYPSKAYDLQWLPRPKCHYLPRVPPVSSRPPPQVFPDPIGSNSLRQQEQKEYLPCNILDST